MTSSSSAPVPGLSLKRITVTYPGHREPVLDGLDLDVADGQLLALLGPSGCGKTTTVQVASGLLTPSRGAVHLGGTDVTRIPPEHRGVAVVFQQPMLLPHRTVLDNVASPPACAAGPAGTPAPQHSPSWNASAWMHSQPATLASSPGARPSASPSRTGRRTGRTAPRRTIQRP
ncbi:ATP-binding cassette domain-containing protein [Streptomyces sp. MT29]|nr:ATP-binding cassette domain-containing protein [Streptomyces sp. MT29]